MMRRLASTTARALLAAALVVALVAQWGGQLLRHWLPVQRAVIVQLGDEFSFPRYSVDGNGASALVRLWAEPRTAARADRWWLSFTGQGTGGLIEATVTAGGALQAPMALLVLVCAWPMAGLREAARRSLASLVACVVLLALEPPLTLLATIRRGLYPDPDLAGDPLIHVGRWLEGGGRLAIGIVGACVIVAISARRKRLATSCQPELEDHAVAQRVAPRVAAKSRHVHPLEPR